MKTLLRSNVKEFLTTQEMVYITLSDFRKWLQFISGVLFNVFS